jgi:hypothetical protein
MIHANYSRLMRNHESAIPSPNGELTQRYIDNIIRPYIETLYDKNDKKILWFLHIILRINYAWAHRTCNATKSNTDFITHRIVRNRKRLYPLPQAALKRILTNIIDNRRWVKGIYEHFINVKTFKVHAESPRVPANLNILPTIPSPSTNRSISVRFNHDKTKLINRSYQTTLVRVKLLCELYNKEDYISNVETYSLPRTHSLLDPLHPTRRRSSTQQGVQVRAVRRRLTRGGEANSNIELSQFIDNIKKTKQSVEIIKKLNYYLKQTDYDENSKVAEFINIIDKKLPNSFNEYDKELLLYIDSLYETKCFKILLLLMTFDYHELEKLEENSYKYYLKNVFKYLNPDEIKRDFIKFITFNYKFEKDKEESLELYEVAEKIYDETSNEMIMYESYIIYFFKKVLIKLYENLQIKYKDIDEDIYEISQMFFKVCISFGLLYNKTPSIPE